MDRQASGATGAYGRGDDSVCDAAWDGPFYAYYQIGGADESDESEAEPKKEGELKSRYEGSHSPFGFVWQIASATGWSVAYILYGVNYQTLMIMLSDAPRYVSGKRHGAGAGSRTAEEEASGIADFFVSQLRG